jgi:hypothetical protein
MSKNKYQSARVNGKKDRVHRHIMQEHLGRKLESYEHVYHVNGDSMDNSIENLIVIKKNQR